jgi:segregation and condensation protein B
MNQKQYKAAVEALLFAHGEPVTVQRLADALGSPVSEVEMALDALRERYERVDSGLCLLHLDERWQLATKQEYGQCVKRILDTRRNTPLSPAAMETLTIVAYNQPVSRSFIEQVRGVDSSSSVSSLMEKGLIEEAGRMDLPGRPVAFRTTDTFLRTFGLTSLRELPPIHTGAGESEAEPSALPEPESEQHIQTQFELP